MLAAPDLLPAKCRRAAAVVAAASGASVLVGASGLAGWITGVDRLKSLSPTWVAMKANTALGFVLAGVALWASSRSESPRALALHRGLGLVVFLLGALTCAEYFAGVDLGIDQLLFHEAPGAISTASPGRMAFISTLSFALMGLALLVVRMRRVAAWVPQALAALVVAISLVALLGYAFGVEMREGASYTHMALHTAGAFFALGVGVLASRDDGPMALVTSPRAGGVLVRTLAPALVAIVVVFSAARVYGERAGSFGAEVGASVLTVASAIAVVVAVLVSGARLDRAEQERDLAREALAERERTRAAELTREVEARTAELAFANRELESFSYSVSHDLRAPLRSILGFSQALVDDCAAQLDEKGAGHLRRIRAAGERMNGLIEDLLALARVGRAELARKDVDVSAMVEQVVASLRGEGPARELEVVVAEGMRANVDPGLLRVTIENVVGNAWKFTRKTASARIEVGVSAQGALYVKDNGAGFDMAYATKLFTPFQRMHASSEFEGTGVGLATVQRILQRHGGKAWAESNVGEGTTIFMTIPDLRLADGRDAAAATPVNERADRSAPL